MSIRLTSRIRDQICNAIMHSRFDTTELALKKEEHDLGLEIHSTVHGEKLLKQIEQIPKGWVSVENLVRVSFAGKFAALSVKAPLSCKDDRGAIADFEATHNFSERYRKLRNDESDLRMQKKSAEKDIRSILESVSTAGKLLEIWPEAATFINKYAKAPVGLPVVRSADINKFLGLPPTTKEAK